MTSKVRESDVEWQLVKRVEECGGTSEKFKSPQKAHVPDQIVCWPKLGCTPAETVFVECKAPGETPRKMQQRDHDRRRKMGFRVYVVDSFEAVEAFLKQEGF